MLVNAGRAGWFHLPEKKIGPLSRWVAVTQIRYGLGVRGGTAGRYGVAYMANLPGQARPFLHVPWSDETALSKCGDAVRRLNAASRLAAHAMPPPQTLVRARLCRSHGS
jgi:hypothetical protein